jgi:hypothetical protein
MTTKWADIFHTDASGWTILVRLSVGLAVFLPEGIQKLIFPDILGAGRFARIGIPFPDVMGHSSASSRPYAACSSLSGSLPVSPRFR